MWSIAEKILGWHQRTPQGGAQTSLYCALDPDLERETGHYYYSCARRRPGITQACDIEVARKLWEVSEELTKEAK